MLKKTKTVRFFTVFTLTFLILFSIGCVCYWTMPIHSIDFSPEGCMLLFQTTPEDFMETYFEFYEETGDFRKHAFIDHNGRLVLYFSLWQLDAWRETEWLSGFSEYPDKKPFSISDDFSEVTVYLPRGSTGEDNEQILYQLDLILRKIEIIQLIDNVPKQDLGVTYIVIDELTGAILHSQYIDLS